MLNVISSIYVLFGFPLILAFPIGSELFYLFIVIYIVNFILFVTSMVSNQTPGGMS
jgi:hypothetical protein